MAKNKLRLGGLKQICPKAHFEPIRVDNGVAEYCNKEEGRLQAPVTYGEKPKNGRPKLAKDVLAMTEEEKLELPMH
jgi:hypothetical protein